MDTLDKLTTIERMNWSNWYNPVYHVRRIMVGYQRGGPRTCLAFLVLWLFLCWLKYLSDNSEPINRALPWAKDLC